jgi:CCR4-NOT transcription complex subunit 6
MGYRRLPQQHCLPRPRPEEDDLQYCPYGTPVGGTVWKVVSSEPTYIPRSDDRDCLFAVDISAGVNSRVTLMTGPCFDPETYTPPLREMLSVFGGSEGQFGSNLAVKLLNWNVLADIYATEQQFEYCPGWALSWDYRKHLILKQIAAIDADVVCLQEVQSDHFEADLLPALKMFGFGHIYAAKTKGLFTNKYTSEGCCVLYKMSRFQKLEHFVLEFDKQAAERVAGTGGSGGDAEVNARLNRLSRGNVALLVLLEDLRHGRRPLGIVTTHVTADVDAGDVKLWQAQCLLENIQQWASPLRHGGPLPLVLCGDFNSTPDSPVYELLTTGQLVQGHVEDPLNLLAGGIGHNVPLRSSHVSVVGNEAPVTNYTLRFSGTLDYIMFSSNTLRAMAVSNALAYEELNRDVALPSPTQPSDHLLSVAVFTYI